MQSFIQFLQENAAALLDAQQSPSKLKKEILDAVLLLELLRTRSEGSCPWSNGLLKAMLLERVRNNRTGRIDPVLWAKIKPETQMAMLELAICMPRVHNYVPLDKA